MEKNSDLDREEAEEKHDCTLSSVSEDISRASWRSGLVPLSKLLQFQVSPK